MNHPVPATHAALNMQNVPIREIAHQISKNLQNFYNNTVLNDAYDPKLLYGFREGEIATMLKPYGFLNPFYKCTKCHILIQHDPRTQEVRRKIKRHIKVYDTAGNNIFAKKGGNDEN